MVIVRSLRSDRVSFCATSFIVNNLGAKFVEPPVLDMKQVVGDSTTRSPLIFVLSTGVVSLLLLFGMLFLYAKVFSSVFVLEQLLRGFDKLFFG